MNAFFNEELQKEGIADSRVKASNCDVIRRARTNALLVWINAELIESRIQNFTPTEVGIRHTLARPSMH